MGQMADAYGESDERSTLFVSRPEYLQEGFAEVKPEKDGEGRERQCCETK